MAMATALSGVMWPLMALVIALFTLNNKHIQLVDVYSSKTVFCRKFVQKTVLIAEEMQKMLQLQGTNSQTPLGICPSSSLGAGRHHSSLDVWP